MNTRVTEGFPRSLDECRLLTSQPLHVRASHNPDAMNFHGLIGNEDSLHSLARCPRFGYHSRASSKKDEAGARPGRP
jgi:hypothetical protein